MCLKYQNASYWVRLYWNGFPVTVLFEDISTAFHRIMSPARHFSHKSPTFSLNVPMSPLYLTRFTQCIREPGPPTQSLPNTQVHSWFLGRASLLVPGPRGPRDVLGSHQTGLQCWSVRLQHRASFLFISHSSHCVANLVTVILHLRA